MLRPFRAALALSLSAALALAPVTDDAVQSRNSFRLIFQPDGSVFFTTNKPTVGATTATGQVPAGASASYKRNGSVTGSASVMAQGTVTCTFGSAIVAGDRFSIPCTLTGGSPAAIDSNAPVAAPVNSLLPAISSTAQVSQTLASSTGSWSGSPTTYAYAWSAGGTQIHSGASNSYVAQAGDVGKTISVTVTASNSAGSVQATTAATGAVVAASASIGGVAINSAGAPGTPYEGFTLSDGMTFASAPSIVSPSNSKADLFDTRAYLLSATGQSPRSAGSGGLTLKGYDVGPAHTGYLDANRGQPVASWADMFQNVNNVLVLKSRAASAAEKALTDGKDILSSMFHTGGRLAARPPAIIEARVKFDVGTLANKAWHPTVWLELLGPMSTVNTIEVDWESDDGSSQTLTANSFNWTNGSSSALGTNAARDNTALMDGTFHVVGWKLRTDGIDYMIDGAVVRSKSFDMTSKGDRAFFFMLTNHVADFANQYSLSAWQTAGATGAQSSIDYVRMWRATGSTHRKPLTETADLNMDFGTTASRTMPSLAAQFGDGTLSETFEADNHEVIAPGGNTNGGWTGLPSFVTRSGDTVTVTNPDKPGRIYFVRAATKPGETVQPSRWAVNVGPNVKGDSALVFTSSVKTIDLYALADVGDLLPKTITLSSLPAGFTFDGGTGILTWDGTTTIVSTDVTVSVANAVGQSTSRVLTIRNATAGIPLPVTRALVGSIDPLDGAKVSTTTGSVNSIGGSDGTTTVATGATGTKPTLVSRGTTGPTVQALRCTAANSQRLDWPNQPARDTTDTRVIIFELASSSATQALFDLADPASSTTTNRSEILFVPSAFRGRRASASALGEATLKPTTLTGRHIMIQTVTAGTTEDVMRLDRQSAILTSPAVAAPTGAVTTTICSRTAAGTFGLPADAYVLRAANYNGALTAQESADTLDWATKYYGMP